MLHSWRSHCLMAKIPGFGKGDVRSIFIIRFLDNQKVELATLFLAIESTWYQGWQVQQVEFKWKDLVEDQQWK